LSRPVSPDGQRQELPENYQRVPATGRTDDFLGVIPHHVPPLISDGKQNVCHSNRVLAYPITYAGTYTLQQIGNSPCLTIKGKFLTDEFGFESGDYFRLIHEDGLLILTRVPKEATANQVREPKPDYFDRLKRQEATNI